VHTEELGAILRMKKKSDGGHYAERNARYDYATLNHFADITDGTNTRGVTLSNWDCAFVRLGRSTPDALDTATAQLHVLAGGQVDGDQLGIRNQNGATHFLQRFALRPHRGYDPSPPCASPSNTKIRPSPAWSRPSFRGAARRFLLASDRERSRVSCSGLVKPAEEGIGHGIIARLWNVTDTPVPRPSPSHPALRLRTARRISRRISKPSRSPPTAHFLRPSPASNSKPTGFKPR
jgi:alpha-mannosidase